MARAAQRMVLGNSVAVLALENCLNRPNQTRSAKIHILGSVSIRTLPRVGLQAVRFRQSVYPLGTPTCGLVGDVLVELLLLYGN